mmetsp:Transcript_14966/g.62290  ORF Transcript_14966/g.62290 Transcript_14966/m.62290 type:complete len:266 (+) Transcript_14966:361-1158(+)
MGRGQPRGARRVPAACNGRLAGALPVHSCRVGARLVASPACHRARRRAGERDASRPRIAVPVGTVRRPDGVSQTPPAGARGGEAPAVGLCRGGSAACAHRTRVCVGVGGTRSRCALGSRREQRTAFRNVCGVRVAARRPPRVAGMDLARLEGMGRVHACGRSRCSNDYVRVDCVRGGGDRGGQLARRPRGDHGRERNPLQLRCGALHDPVRPLWRDEHSSGQCARARRRQGRAAYRRRGHRARTRRGLSAAGHHARLAWPLAKIF